MASKRNRIDKLKSYIETFGIDININKNKAQGNKGFFKAAGNSYRIDISKGLTEDQILKTLVHEFSHFIHYKYDKSLQDLSFVFFNYNESLKEELIKNTVNLIPKNTVSPLFTKKEELNNEIKFLAENIKNIYPDFKLSASCKSIEKSINKTPYKLLLKYDRIKILGFFSSKMYSITSIENYIELKKIEKDYLVLKSKQRALKRLNSRISKYNRYYNSPTELFARSIEQYISDKNKLEKETPILYKEIEMTLKENRIPELTKLIEHVII